MSESNKNQDLGHENEDKTGQKLRPPIARNACLPILFFVIYVVTALIVLGAANVPIHEQVALHTIFANIDSITVMYYGASLGSLFAGILYRIQRLPSSENSSQQVSHRNLITSCMYLCPNHPIMSFEESIQSFLTGFTHLTTTVMILVLAWSIGLAVDTLGAGPYLASTLQGAVAPTILPTLIFFIACFVSFSTGSSFGTMALLFPICGDVAFILSNGNPELYYCSLAAILEGSVFGDHCSFISDTTIISSMACKCPLTNHVLTQIPYAFFVAAVSLLAGFLPIGVISIFSTYLLGFFLLIFGIFSLGANPRGDRLDIMNLISVKFQTGCLKKHPDQIEVLSLMKPINLHNKLGSETKPSVDNLTGEFKKLNTASEQNTSIYFDSGANPDDEVYMI